MKKHGFLDCGKGFGMKEWSDRAEIFTRGGHDTSPGVFFFVFNFDLSVKNKKDFRINKRDLWKTFSYFHHKN